MTLIIARSGREALPDDILSTGSDLVEEVADPLFPAGATAVCLDCVEQALAKVRRVTFYPSGSDDLNFVRLSPKQARLIVERARRSRDPVVLTAGRKVLTSS